ncbi:MAG: CBS domain-containing protein [Proteobacteria bacterium]|nr:CBS domain-containing protein [Pseudomonadota bacterium]
MTVARLCRRSPLTAYESESLPVAAQRMRETHVGFLVVIRPQQQRVVGVITDRDIVTAVVAQGASPSEFTVGDVMTRNPLLIEESQSPVSALGLMREAGVRRVPVVAEGQLVGVLSVDDLLGSLAQQLSDVVQVIRTELTAERSARP